MIRNAVLVCHRCHTEFGMGDDIVAPQEKQAAEETGSLPLFEKEHEANQQPEGQRQTAADEGKPKPPKSDENEESEIEAIPVFLTGKHAYVEQTGHEEPSLAKSPHAERKRRPAQLASDENTAKAETKEAPKPKQPAPVPDTEADALESDDALTDTQLPQRTEVAIWPWLIVMLLVIGSVGFWYKKEAWLDDPWFRSVLINMYLPVEVRDKDWLIIPSSVQGNWLKRDDNSQVLVIQGRVENLLYTTVKPPKILVRFYDDTGISDSLGEKLMEITEPPSMEQIKHAPFASPGVDRIPVESQGQRGFFLVLEDLPDRTADFTLSPVATK